MGFSRYLQRVVCHPSLLQDPDVREFLERDEVGALQSLAVNTFHRLLESCINLRVCLCVCMRACVCLCQLPRAVGTHTLSGAGFLKMINRASDAVSKMTIKISDSDAVRQSLFWLIYSNAKHEIIAIKSVI